MTEEKREGSSEDRVTEGGSNRKGKTEEAHTHSDALQEDSPHPRDSGISKVPDKLLDYDVWEETKDELLKMTDALGMPIDSGIFDTIVGLNANGYDTSASCEGHLDWGLPYPWVEIAVDDKTTHELLEKIFTLSDTIHDMTSERDINGEDDSKNATDGTIRTTTGKADVSDDSDSSTKTAPDESEELKRLYKKRVRIERELEVVREERRRPVRELLAEFYEHRRPVRYGLILHLAELDRIECIESNGQILKPLHEQAERLEEYRAEFAALADFLRERLG